MGFGFKSLTVVSQRALIRGVCVLQFWGCDAAWDSCPKWSSIALLFTSNRITFDALHLYLTSTQYIVSFGGLLQLNTTGQWSVQIKTTTADSRSTWALVNNVNVPINTTTQTGIFQVNATGEVCLRCFGRRLSNAKCAHLSYAVLSVLLPALTSVCLFLCLSYPCCSQAGSPLIHL